MECLVAPAGPNRAPPAPVPASGMDPDHALVLALRRGEHDGLAEAYRRHGARVYRLALRMLGRTPDAEDATQEVFLELFERARSFAGRSRFSTWLHRVTVNHCLHRLEKEGLRAVAPLSGDEHDAARGPAEEHLARGEARESLELLLLRLAPAQRAILLLREIEGLSYQEIAETLEIPAGTVMSRLSRAREDLLRLARLEEARNATAHGAVLSPDALPQT